MILQALVKLYDDLVSRGEISRPGWSKTKISHALCLNTEGDLLQIVSLQEETERNGKTVIVNQFFDLPAPVKRSLGVLPNFLWDHSGYVLGLDDKGNPQRSVACYYAFAEHHRNLLGKIDHDVARGILNFLNCWSPESGISCDVLNGVREDLLRGGNLMFRVNGIYPHTVPEIAEAWQRCYDNRSGTVMQCLITGKEDVVESVHPSIKGVNGSQSSGAALVSFNADAFCSYNRKQGFNAPVGKRAAFAYTSALNHLLADRDNVWRISDTTVVCWADGAEPQYQKLSLAAIFAGKNTADPIRKDDLLSVVSRLAEGNPCPELSIDPSREFYILGLAPNAARLSVRFFLRTTFGDLMRNVNGHHERCKIIGSRCEPISLRALLRETANANSKEKSPNPAMAGAVARAVFSGTAYPVSLLSATMLRIRAEREVTSGRAAIVKAYYLKNSDARCPEEVLTVSLNENSTNIPYTIGRLFAVYEAVQQAAIPGINVTVKDKYFNSVASTPAHILPILDSLCQKHLRKLTPGRRVYFDRQIGEIKNIMGEENPVRLSLPEQGSFYLGYYHQKQKRFEKKENN